jgi:predicted RNase H-like HicB family nuclease
MTMSTTQEKRKLQVLIEQDEEGMYHASCMGLNGCYASGESYLEAVVGIQEKLEAMADWLRETGMPGQEAHATRIVWSGRYA